MLGASTSCLADRSLGVALHRLTGVEGIDFVEIVNEGYHVLDGHNCRPHLEVLEGHGLRNIIHAPFSDINIASLNERIRRTSLEIVFETLRIAQDMGSLLVVLHPGHRSPLSGKFPKAYEKVHRRSLEEIDKTARRLDVKVALENMPAFPILDGQTVERMFEFLDGTDLYVTFDVGHLNTVNGEFKHFIDTFGDRIIHVHLHDNDGKRDSHLALGEGNIPWERVLKLLPKRATWGLEMERIEDLEKSIKFLKR